LVIVRLRDLYLPSLVALGAAAVVLPAIAASEPSPTVGAVNTPGAGLSETHSWSPSQVTVAEGGVVTFQNASAVPHGVEWVGGPAKPACSSGVPVGTSVEASPSGTNWSGTCTFAKAGSYVFYCTVHGPEMTGRITVSANGTTTVTAPAMPPAPPTPPGAGTPVPGSPGNLGPEVLLGSPVVGGIAKAVRLAGTQRGRSVRGSVQVSQAGVGGRLEIELLASGAAGKARRAARVQYGRLVRSSLYAGPVPFAVPLNGKGKAALLGHRRLRLTVRIALTPLRGATVTIARTVVVHV
jgi:plastocyanin